MKSNHLQRIQRYRNIRQPKIHLPMAFRYLPGEWILVNLRTGSIIDCSNEFAQLAGMARKTILKQSVSEFSFTGNEQGWGLKRLNMDLLHHSGRYEDVGLTTPDSITLVTDIQVSHINRKGISLAFCLITDKSHQRQLQGELISKHQELKRAFRKLEIQARELNATQDELKQKNRNISELSTKSRATAALATIGEITAELTHQLNNPLAAATGASRKLSRLFDTGKTDQMSPMLKLLSTSLQRLKETVDEVHIIYRHSRVPVSPEGPIQIREQLTATQALLEHRLRGIDFRQQIPDDIPPIRGHQSLFQHVILNLLENAVEAVRDAIGEAKIIEFVAQKRGSQVAISIGDNGPGIPSHEYDRIFEAFYTLKEKGSGLGLTAVKRYVERDNATIEVSDSEFGGAQFTICYAIFQEPDAERKG
jgi:C4-dicarboxylate-specific signal transduction histidine kinase